MEDDIAMLCRFLPLDPNHESTCKDVLCRKEDLDAAIWKALDKLNYPILLCGPAACVKFCGSWPEGLNRYF